jgi:hypothetical protein
MKNHQSDEGSLEEEVGDFVADLSCSVVKVKGKSSDKVTSL